MRYWLFKSEPKTWSWDDQVKAGSGEWDGVRNYQARNFMREMAVGDRGFFYHSIGDKEIVGIVEVTVPAHPDSTDTTGKWECVDIKAIEPLVVPVSLAQIKADERLVEMALVKNSRLSVQPVTADEWAVVLSMGNPGAA